MWNPKSFFTVSKSTEAVVLLSEKSTISHNTYVDCVVYDI